PVVPRVRHIQPAGSVHGDARGTGESRRGPDAIQAPDHARYPPDRGHDSITGYPADRRVARIGDVNVTRAVRHDPERIIESRKSAHAIDAAGQTRTAGDGRDRT